ncbi:choice-of-anchor G family protein, partial [Leucobacter sp. M11]|uniref:choice-of-anchor G family protein n=1 Tax=Leucobacter sp. M11 TaxID=2993565 RepID=UPI002D8084CC
MVALGGVTSAANAATGDESRASARFLSGSLLSGLNLDAIAGLGGVNAHNAGVPATDTKANPLDVSALSLLQVQIPGGLNLPLSNLIQLGAVNQYASAEDAGASHAASGAVSNSGGIGTGNASGFPANATFTLESILGPTLSQTIGNLSISIGAITAEAHQEAPAAATGAYSIAGGQLNLTIPAVGGITSAVVGTNGSGGIVGAVDTAVAALAGPDGTIAKALAGLNAALSPLLGNTGLKVELTTTINNTLNQLLDTPVGDGVITINLRTGSVTADLDALLSSSVGHGLNGLGVNEEILSTAVLDALNVRIASVLNTVPALVQTTVENTLNAAQLTVQANVCIVGSPPNCVTPLVDIGTGINVNVDHQTLGMVLNGNATASITLKVAGAQIQIGLGQLLGALAAPIKAALFDPPLGVLSTVVPIVSAAVSTVLTAASPAVSLLNTVVSLKGNVQEVGSEGSGSFRQTALRLGLGSNLLATVDLASAEVGPNSVRELEGVAITAPAPNASFTVPTETDTEAVTVSGTGDPGASVTVSIPGQSDQTATVQNDNTWTVTFPALPVGTYTATATQLAGTTETTATVTFGVAAAPVGTDTDADADADADAAADTDADAATDTDATDTDAAADTDAATDTDAAADTDAATDTDAAADTDAATDTDAAADTDAATDT